MIITGKLGIDKLIINLIVSLINQAGELYRVRIFKWETSLKFNPIRESQQIVLF